jgi:hypothetical protein
MNFWIQVYAVLFPLPFLKFIEMLIGDPKRPEEQIKELDELEKKEEDEEKKDAGDKE